MSGDSPRMFPVDEFVREELHPGYKEAFGSQPYVAGPVRPFSHPDNARYWLRAPGTARAPGDSPASATPGDSAASDSAAGEAGKPAFDPVKYALRNVFKVPGS